MTDPNPLARFRGQHVTLDDLVDVAGRLLRRLNVRSDDGRVNTVPDDRGVRYYQTLGLVDKPLHYDGRRAIYGYRHLLQLLAVKLLQQEGNPLHLIQQTLAGRPTDALERALAAMFGGVPPASDEPGTPPRGLSMTPVVAAHVAAPAPPPTPAATTPRSAAPVPDTTPASHPAAGTEPLVKPASRPSPASRPLRFGDAALVATRLAPGVTLVVDPNIVDDPAALVSALMDLLDLRQKEQ